MNGEYGMMQDMVMTCILYDLQISDLSFAYFCLIIPSNCYGCCNTGNTHQLL
jgi:hypothetical protein